MQTCEKLESYLKHPDAEKPGSTLEHPCTSCEKDGNCKYERMKRMESVVKKHYPLFPDAMFELPDRFTIKGKTYEYGYYGDISITVYYTSDKKEKCFYFYNGATGAWFYTQNQEVFGLARMKAERASILNKQLMGLPY